MNTLRYAVVLLVVGCGTRPLTIDVDPTGAGGGSGGGSQPGTGGGGSGAGSGGPVVDTGGRGAVAGAGGAGLETGCAYLEASQPLVDCGGAETLSLSELALKDYVGDGTVSAGDAAFVSLTLEAGDQAFGYPSIGLTSDNPLVTIAPASPQATVYGIGPHEQIGATFDFLVDYAVADNTVVHFTACPGRLGAFCRGGPRLSFDVTVHPAVFPSWIPTTGRPAGAPPCSSTAPASDRVCGNLDGLWFSNPRAVASRNGGALFVRSVAWLTNGGARGPNVCVRAASGGRTSNVAYIAVPAGKSAFVGTSTIELDPTLPAGAKVHITAWVDAIEADCNNGGRIEFDATVP